MRTISVAVVGLGYFSQFHLRSWQQMAGVNLIAVCDPKAQARDAVSTQFSVPAFGDLCSLLKQCDAQILDIVAPPSAHAALIAQGVKKDRLIICQKPFCTSVDEAKATIKLAKQGGATLIIHENFRFQPWYNTLKAFIHQGEMGQIYQCRFALRPGDGRGVDAYLARQPSFQEMPRFLIHETAVHLVDLFSWLLGPIESVYADLRQLNPVIAGEDAGTVLFTHKNGPRSQFDGNRHVDHVADNPRLTMGEMCLEGEGGTILLNGHGQLLWRRFGQREAQLMPLLQTIDYDTFGGGCVDYLNKDALAAFLKQKHYQNQAHDYLHVMQVCETIYQSAAQQRRLPVPEAR